MRDGNKESAKELLSTFRTLIAISLSIILFGTNRTLFPITGCVGKMAAAAALSLVTASLLVSVYICLIVIPKLDDETADIIHQTDVRWSSFFSLVCFLVGCVLLVASQYM